DISLEPGGKYTGGFRLTPQGAVKLFFGSYDLDQILSFLPDCHLSPAYREVIETLFPRLDSHFYINY
ncbi:MAG: hypothetical protein UMV23_06835, partial [Halanaerobium sp.]|nr:hypothetical protein [Halanaerobium sp.]